jgi:biopolymer transport protein ExbB
MHLKINMNIVIVFFFITFLAPLFPAAAQEEKVTESVITEVQAEPEIVTENNKKGMSLFELIKKGGIVGFMIILLSFVAVGLIIDYSLTIRKSKLAPLKDIEELKNLIRNKKFTEIKKLDQEKTSFLAHVVIAGLKESNLGYQTMIKAMEDASEALSAGIARKIEHLNVIGNISPMMGLLGTVIGMLRCFNEISQATGAIEPKQLAGGIFEALITTCMGLVVAIPSLYFYALFKNRVDEITGEASLAAEELVTSFKPESLKE